MKKFLSLLCAGLVLCGSFGGLGVQASEYIPYYALALVMTAVTVFFAATGISVKKLKTTE